MQTCSVWQVIVVCKAFVSPAAVLLTAPHVLRISTEHIAYRLTLFCSVTLRFYLFLQGMKEKVDSLMKAGKLLAVDHDLLKVRHEILGKVKGQCVPVSRDRLGCEASFFSTKFAKLLSTALSSNVFNPLVKAPKAGEIKENTFSLSSRTTRLIAHFPLLCRYFRLRLRHKRVTNAQDIVPPFCTMQKFGGYPTCRER